MQLRLYIFYAFLACHGISISSLSAQHVNRKITYAAFGAIGRSTFHSSIDGPSKFPTAELRLGPVATLPLSSKFYISSKLLFGVKMKRERMYIPGQPTTLYGPFIDNDRMAGSNHFFLELPLLVEYRLNYPRLIFGLGVNYRKFFSSNGGDGGSFDPLSNKNEIGALGKLGLMIKKRWVISIEHFLPFNKLYTVAGWYDNTEYRMSVENRYVQIGVAYRWGRLE